MGPKIDAALDFLATGERVLITALPRLADALAGRCDTWITS
jgi:carbamate kinase